MTSRRQFVVGVTSLVISIAGAGIAAAQSGSTAKLSTCDRACLDGFIDKYLTALTSHDATRIPTSRNVKFTENTKQMKLGEGVWQTATGVGSYRIRLADPRSGQAIFFGVLKEDAKTAMFALRIKVESQQIAEVET